MLRPPPDHRTASSNRFYEHGLTEYAANNSTAMAAAPFELSPDDIARLDDDITANAFREDFGRSSAPFSMKPRESEPFRFDNHFNYNDKENIGINDFPGYQAKPDIANHIPSSSPYIPRSPLQPKGNWNPNKYVLTPPSSSPYMEKPAEANRQRQAIRQPEFVPDTYNHQAGPSNDGALFEMQQMYEEKIDRLKRTEQERFENLESGYKQRINKLQADLEEILSKQNNVLKLKSQVEAELQRDLEKARSDLRSEHEKRRKDRDQYEEKIRELKGRVEELQKRIKKMNGPADAKDRPSLVRSYESKLADLQQESDQKIADLVRQFEREKQSALQIMKTRIKSEVNLLVPRIRNQCQEAFNQALVRCQEQTASKYREKYGTVIKRMKEEHVAEKRFLQKQAKEAAEVDLDEWKRKIKAKYEMKALEVKNECERRLIERMRSSGKKQANVSFAVSDLSSPTDSSFDDWSFMYN